MGRRIPVDPRSTQRKRARKTLFRLGVPYICVECNRSPKFLPRDAPHNLETAPVGIPNVSSSLQANHINKNIMDNDPVNLEWLCASCHKKKDQQTAKGESLIDDEFGWGF